ncbi:uncharacterized protein LOC106728660 isoform X2 [Camelus ferus]|uniref:Uncharacterized protein LOC106728660 isoform X2 n=1 Tax=Camelus ferus TaxID=419612 RepID=A0A8B8U187_CAMFR|nr:uncharacterized protein LOC106728660 isoform X2 [Camelus ferus]XP_032348343.1 uncharacterized protein LOC106728660 isoform X2 [Camelus ferus]XP_032348344.1 uncharacterized protein LOC106728660 isoform X2 [Camelus ferus]
MSGRAEAGPALSPRSPSGPPARRLPLCPGPAPLGRPVTARTPQRARRPGAGSSDPGHPPARPGMHVNLEKVAGRASADLRGRAWAPLARRAFVFVPDKGPSRCRSRTWRPCTAGYSSGKSSCSRQGSRSREERSSAVRCAVRDQGSGAWPCALPARSRSCPALRRVAGDGIALLSALPTGEGENHPEPRTHTEGLCSRGHDSAALAASGRARPSGKGRAADQRAPVSVGFKSTLGDDTDLICDRQTPLSRLASGNGLLSRTDLGISLVLAAFCEDLLCVPAKLLGFRIHSSSLMTALDGLAPPSRPPCCPTDAWSLDDCASSRPCPGSGPGRLHQRAGRHCARGQEEALRWELLSEAGLPHAANSPRWLTSPAHNTLVTFELLVSEGSLATVCPSIWMEEERGPISLCPARTPRRPHPAPFSPPSHASALKCGPDNTGCLPST